MPRATTSTKYLLAVLFLVGLFLRVYQLGALSLSEDESHKITAVQSYLKGDITANAEHPMLMKLMMTASVSFHSFWNRHVNWKISEEGALRFPNAVFGAATTIPLYYLTASFFGPQIGLLTSAFWSTGINAITTNRIGKEDTLFVFFMLPAFLFYRLAKLQGTRNLAQVKRLYTRSGAMFGLQLASKYLPGYIGMNALFYYILGRRGQDKPMPEGMTKRYLRPIFIVFLVANVALLVPDVWVYISEYLREKLLAHHGYQMMGVLYYNVFSRTFTGTPFYYYLLYLLVKAPIPILILFVAGLAHAYAHRPGVSRFFLRFLFFWWMIPYSLIGGKWIRYVLPYLPFFYMTAAVGFAILLREIRKRTSTNAANYIGWIGAVALIVFSAVQSFIHLPAPSLYVNAVGGGETKTCFYFPQDELYDAGLREAYEYLSVHAEQGSTVATDAVGVFDYYTDRLHRTDLVRTALVRTEQRFLSNAPVYILLHDGNRYFENDSIFQYLKDTQTPLTIIKIRNFNAVRIYRMSSDDFLRASSIEREHPGNKASQS